MAQMFAEIFQCSPFDDAWTLDAKGKCINLNNVLFASALLNVATSVLILVLPMPLLWRLHVSTQQKVELIGIFLLGGL